MKPFPRNLALAAAVVVAALAPSRAEQRSGCVTQLPGNPNALVFATSDQCLLLTGNYDPTRFLNREAVLQGTFLAAAGLLPDRLQVSASSSIGPACSQACTLAAPGTRGLHSSGPASHVTGTAPLVSGAKEPAGYGLYSYAVLTHSPGKQESDAYRAFITALVGLPTAAGLAANIPLSRINITEIPVTEAAAQWETMPPESRTAFVLEHYDYARGTAILSTLSQRTGDGPIIVSVLSPIDPAQSPKPVLVEDLSVAQPTMMQVGVDNFKIQAARDQVWDVSKITAFSFQLRNTLEIAATEAGMSRTQVMEWVKLIK